MYSRKRKNIIIGSLALMLVIMGVGFSILSQTLRINASGKLNGKWDVKIIDVTPQSNDTNAVDVNHSIVDDGLGAELETNFNEPGDYLEYLITVKNEGTIKAQLEQVNVTNNSASSLIKLTNNAEINYIIDPNEIMTFTVKVEFPLSVTSMSNTTAGDYTVSLLFKQVNSSTEVPTEQQICTVQKQAYEKVVTKLEKEEYVKYNGYLIQPEGIFNALSKLGLKYEFVDASFDETEKVWKVDDEGTFDEDGYAAFYQVKQSGYYQIFVEDGIVTYMMDADKSIQLNQITSYLTSSKKQWACDGSKCPKSDGSRYERISKAQYLDAGDVIIIATVSPGASFYIAKIEDGDPTVIGTKYNCYVNETTAYTFYGLSKNSNTSYNLLMANNIYYNENTNFFSLSNETYNGAIDWISKTDFNDDSLWNSSIKNTKGPLTALKYANKATSNWSNIKDINERYEDANGKYSTLISGKVRLPKASEIGNYRIGVGPTPNNDASLFNDFYYDNMAEYEEFTNRNVVSTVKGYYTMDTAENSASDVIFVRYDGMKATLPADSSAHNFGVRPVIKVTAGQLGL